MKEIKSPVKVSIVIPALNEEKFIGQTLQSLSNLTFDDGYEVIVVDNGSSDNTCDIVKSFKNELQVSLYVVKDVNISALRNFGVSKSTGDILAFLDADCTVSKEWATNAVHYFKNPKIGAVGAMHLTPENSSWVANSWDHVLAKKRLKKQTESLRSGNLWTSKTAFLDIQGFNEKLKTNEDYDFCFRLTQKGYLIFSDPEIKAWHLDSPKTVLEFYKKNKWHGTHVAKVFLENIWQLNNAKAIAYGLYHLIFVSLVLFVVVFTISLKPIFLLMSILIMPSIILSLNTLKTRSEFRAVFQLSLLYFVYGLARAHSLFENIIDSLSGKFKLWKHNRTNCI